MTPENALIVAVPTHDMRMVIPSLLELNAVGRQVRRPLQFVMGQGSNIPRSRNHILQQLRQLYPHRDTAWVLWIDSDIWIRPESALAIAEALEWAHQHEQAIVGNYRMVNGASVFMHSRNPQDGRHYSDEELAQLPDYSEIALTGFGFAYVPQLLDYTFRADDIGEDIHFWWDHPEIHLHWPKAIHLGHLKEMLLTA